MVGYLVSGYLAHQPHSLRKVSEAPSQVFSSRDNPSDLHLKLLIRTSTNKPSGSKRDSLHTKSTSLHSGNSSSWARFHCSLRRSNYPATGRVLALPSMHLAVAVYISPQNASGVVYG
jgi:hypothetical protein